MSACLECKWGSEVELGGGNESSFPEGMPLLHPNIDIRPGPLVDIVHDIEKDGIPLHDGHATHIKSCHLINHLSIEGSRKFLKECHRVLKPGGKIFIMVTDMDYVFKMIQQEGFLDKWTSSVWGEQKIDQGYADFHKSGFNFAHLKGELEKASFINVKHAGYYNPWDLQCEAQRP